MARFDIHRPAAIEPRDYRFVAFDYLKCDDLGSALFIAEERRRKAAHMKETGGKYSGHEHGGSCHVCGAHAIYTVTFYHAKTNTYISTGLECAEKMECRGAEAFRKKVHVWLEARAGKKKAKATLEAAGAVAAWALLEAIEERREKHRVVWNAWHEANPEPKYRPDGPYGVAAIGEPVMTPLTDAERTVTDIVGKLVKYGSISDKALNYVKVLLNRIERAPAIAAARAAEADAAKPVPVVPGRMKIVGEVVSLKESDGPYGFSIKMLVKHADGWKLWGTKPSSLDVARGDKVEFEAAVKVSDRDPKFGFFSRPSKSRLIAA